ncbi:MAG: hypothetical protein ABIQ43_06365 [Sphingomonas sp.]
MSARGCIATEIKREERVMGKGILMWLIGIPIPIIILLLLFWH